MKILRVLFPFLFVKDGIEASYSSKNNERLTQYEKYKLATTDNCPDCGGDLLLGPHGAGINIACEKCGAKFNRTPLLAPIKKGELIPMFADRISDRTTPVPA